MTNRLALGGESKSKSNGITFSDLIGGCLVFNNNSSTLSIRPRSKKVVSLSGSPSLTFLPSSPANCHSVAIGATSTNEKSHCSIRPSLPPIGIAIPDSIHSLHSEGDTPTKSLHLCAEIPSSLFIQGAYSDNVCKTTCQAASTSLNFPRCNGSGFVGICALSNPCACNIISSTKWTISPLVVAARSSRNPSPLPRYMWRSYHALRGQSSHD